MRPRIKAVRVAAIVRSEFRCSQMAAVENSLDDALEIMRSWIASQQVVDLLPNIAASDASSLKKRLPLQASAFEVSELLGRSDWPMALQHSIVDIRPAEEFSAEGGRIPKALNVPWMGRDDALSFVLRAVEQHGISRASRLILVGANGNAARDVHDAATALSDVLGVDLGVTVVLRGGLAAWRDESLPIECCMQIKGLKISQELASRYLQTRAWS